MGIKIPVDFEGVPERGTVRVPEGDYILKAKSAEKKNSKGSGNPMLVVKFEFASGPKDVKGKSIVDRHILIKDSLWTLRNMLESMGYKVPAKRMKLDVDTMILGKTVGATIVDDDEYKGRIKSIIGDYIPVSAVGNRVSGEDADALLEEEEEEDDDGLGAFSDSDDSDDSPDEAEDDSVDEDDEEEDSFDFDEEDDEEEDEGSVVLSFGPDDIDSAKGAALKEYVKEAQEAGFDLDLGNKPKVAEVREALASLFETEDEENFEDMEEFSLDDV
jgi:hypothetical protein